MTRHRRLRLFTRFLLLLVPGSALAATGTSCGDVVRQTVLSSGSDFLNSLAGDLASQFLSSLLGQTIDTTTTS